MMYFYLFLSSFVALYSGQALCVYMACTDTDFCIYDICGLWVALVYFYGHVYGCMFMDVHLRVCLGMCLGSYLWPCVWVSCLDPLRGLVQ